MAWPFTTPASGPTDFAAPGTQVPTSATEIGGGVARWLLGISIINKDTVERTVVVTDTAGGEVYRATLPPGGGPPVPYSPTFEPVTGIKWSVDGGTAVIGHVWGY